MRLRSIVTVFLALLLCIGMVGGATGTTQAAEMTNLRGVVQGQDTLRPRLQLTNISEKPCQVINSAIGTVAITQLQQDGKDVSAQPLNVGHNEPLDYLMKQQFKTLKAGESATIPLDIFTADGKHYLRSVSWAEGTEFGSLYQLTADQPLSIALNYTVPLEPASGAPACGSVFVGAATTTSKQSGWWKVLGALIFAVLLITWIIILIRKRRPKAMKAAMAIALTAGVLGAFSYAAQPASAAIDVPADLRHDFDVCMGVFEANRDITGPVLNVINDPSNNIHIIRTNGGTENSGIEHNYWIYWNPIDFHPYAGTGGTAEPCDSLYHEMVHIWDMANGTFDMSQCGDSGIRVKEVVATRKQNELRERLGLPQRSHYGDLPLPSGDCTPPTPPGGAPRCVGPACGDSNGDPHLRTFDGLRYDFQAAGEFTAARNQSGSYEIQTRQEPWLDSRVVSMNTAVALKVDGDRVEVRAGKKNMELLVRGKRVQLADQTLPRGGTLSVQDGTIVVTWKDASKAWIRPVGSYGLHLAAEPSQTLAGQLQGLLGDGNGDPKNDLRARGSTKNLDNTFKALYPSFADSWRITDESSLFTYSKNSTTSTYTDRSFPDKQTPKPADLPGYAAALAFCKSSGISDPAILANCALDVSLTGSPAFATAALSSQTITASADHGGTAYKLNVTKPGGRDTATFAGTAGEKIFVDIPHSTLPSRCGIIKLIAPDNTELTSGCIINNVGNIDGIVLPATGTYTLALQPYTDTGSADLRLLRIRDKQGSITPDGASIQVVIDKPGVVARYTFSATAGQPIFVDVPRSTLPSRCGNLRLLGPDGNPVGAGGCIINGEGYINTTIAPAAGTYTAVLDPLDSETGTATLRLVFATNNTKAITPGGPSITTKLSKPGSIARYTFKATAGQRVMIDVTQSDLQDRCGVLYLMLPDGSTQGSGCIINSKGNLSSDPYLITQTGTYTLVLDPSEADTGSATVRVGNR